MTDEIIQRKLLLLEFHRKESEAEQEGRDGNRPPNHDERAADGDIHQPLYRPRQLERGKGIVEGQDQERP